MKTTLSPSIPFKKTTVLLCFALALLFTNCEDQWGHTASMRYVIGVVDNGGGSCTYNMASKPDDKTSNYQVVTDCHRWAVGEGFFVSQ